MIDSAFKIGSGFVSWLDAMRVRIAGRFVMALPITIERAIEIAETLRDQGYVDRAIELLKTAHQQFKDMIVATIPRLIRAGKTSRCATLA